MRELNGRLELLDMSDNCLRSLPASNLRGMTRLMYVDLANNSIDDLPNMSFMNLPALKELRLNANNISTLGRMAFLNVPELEYLYLQDNQISTLEPIRFEAFTKLQVLNMAGNRLKTIRSSSFSKVPNLKRVNLDRNQIETIETLAFSSNPNLQIVSFQNNKIRELQRNMFESSDRLISLLFANNSLTSIGAGVFEGVKGLQQLNLHNNSISVIEPGAFQSVAALTTLALSHNRLETIPKDAFEPLKRLFWLDLSNNRLQRFADGTFSRKVPNIILHGNPLVCDSGMDAFVEYLVRENVRTFLPNQPDVACSAPDEFAGVRLKELMIKRANYTFFRTLSSLASDNIAPVGASNNAEAGGVPFQNLFPSIKQIPGLSEGIRGLTDTVPALGAFTQGIPGLNQLPDLSSVIGLGRSVNSEAAGVGNGGGAGGKAGSPSEPQSLGQALTGFTDPLTNLANRRQPLPSDINQLVQSIPNLASHLPPLPGGIDVSKLDPNLIKHVLTGGQIPGVSKQTLDHLIQQYYLRVAQAAEQANAGKATQAILNKLPAVTSLPTQLIEDVLRGSTLPGLSTAQTQEIQKYYMSTLAAVAQTEPLPSSSGTDAEPTDGATQPAAARVPLITGIPPEEILNHLPANFDLTRVPPALLQQFASGRQPDLSLLPADMLESLLKANPTWANSLDGGRSDSDSIDNHLESTTNFFDSLHSTQEQEARPTYQPYNIEDLDLQNKLKGSEANSSPLVSYVTAGGLALVALLTVVVLAYFVHRRHRTRAAADDDDTRPDDDDAASFLDPKRGGVSATPAAALPYKHTSNSPADHMGTYHHQQPHSYHAQSPLPPHHQLRSPHQPHAYSNPAAAVFDPYSPYVYGGGRPMDM